MKAKDFNLPDQFGKMQKLTDYRGKWVVLYFYPRDNTPGCTKEACGFRDIVQDFKKKNAVIFGVSKDTVESHKKFADKHHINFPILSDTEKVTIKDYGSWGEKKFLGKVFTGTLRNTFLIDPEGNIRHKFEKVNPIVHPQEILNILPQ